MADATVLKGARVVDPSRGFDAEADVVIVGDSVAEEPARVDFRNARVVDLTGLVVAPGFIDLHVHLREPGQTRKETIATGSRAAAAGGFSTIVAMPNTAPPIDTTVRLEDALERIHETAAVRVLQTAALSTGRDGTELTDAAALRRAGAVALTDDGSCLQDAGLMLTALQRACEAGIPVIEHCEDASLSRDGVVHAGRVADRLGLPGQPSIAESLVAVRDLMLSRESGWPIHLQHISAAETVEIVRQARARGIELTAEATPHHILFTEEACIEHGTNAKMNPPLRGHADRQALRDGLRDGTIAAIATDHAPHTAEEKARGWLDAPFGVVGLEAAVPICLTTLFHSGLMSLCDVIAALTSKPARILGLPYGTLAPGSPADLVVLDVDVEHELRVDAFLSKGRNCPYDGLRCRGRSVGLMVGGEWVYSGLPGISGSM